MKNYALIENGNVTNIIIWDGETTLDLDEGVIAIEATERCSIGGAYDGKKFIPPEPPKYEL